MLKTKNLLLICLAFASLIWGCDTEPTIGGGGTVVAPPAPFKAVAPPFNADSAYASIETQLAFGPRIPNTAAHRACANWMAASLDRFGAAVTVQAANVTAWDGTNFAIQNIIGSYKPEARNRVLVSCHWDSRPFADKDPNTPNAPVPAANDGASGVAVILEIARQLQIQAPTIGVDLILFDAEDYGNYDIDDSWCLGSQYWGKNLHKPNYTATYGINLDMVGAGGAQFVKDGYSMSKAPQFVNQYWSLAHNLGYASMFPVGDFGFASIDDHYYVMQLTDIPMIEVIDRNTSTGEFFEHWHKATDDIQHIDKNTLKAVGQTTLEMVLREK